METPQVTDPPAPPAQEPSRREITARTRIPMSIPRRKLDVPEIPGYFLYWHLESNVPAALQAGYEFVDMGEVPVHQMGIGTDTRIEGSSDLGSRIRVHAGIGQSGASEYHVLMKLRQEWRDEDQKVIDQRNADIMGGIFQKEQIMDGSNQVSETDKDQRYVKTAEAATHGKKPLFLRPARKAPR